MNRNQQTGLIGLFVLTLMIGLLVINMPQERDERTRAASAALEAEDGTLSGPVQTVSDTAASGGKYVKFSPTGSTTVSPTQPSGNATYPAEVLNLTNWKITLPSGSSGSPTEIKQPQLATFKSDPWFVVAPGGGVRFRAPVNGVTTSGSSYPRSELREMANNGTSNAAWSSTSGTHTMFYEAAITAVPQTKRHIVVGQIHDGGDDVIVIRLEYPVLYVHVGTNPPGGNQNVLALDSNYTLGKKFTIKMVAGGGATKIYYNGAATPAYTLNRSYSGAYFKVGAYTQSNCSRESSSSLCNANNYGESIVYQVQITHQ